MRKSAMRLLAAIFYGVFLTATIHAAEDTFAYDARESLAKLQAMDIFPEMEKEDSDFANAVSTEVECLECEEPTFFKSPAWPIRAAWRVAARLGMKGRSVAEIRAHLAKTFELDAEAFQQVHGIQIVSARLTLGSEVLDVTPQMAARVSESGFTVDCDGSLVAALADESQFDRTTDESNPDYWKRQRKLLAAVADARPGQETLRIVYEFQSETCTAVAKSGERLTLSEEGKVSVAKIAPTARAVGAIKPASPPEKSVATQEKPAITQKKPVIPSVRTGSIRDFK